MNTNQQPNRVDKGLGGVIVGSTAISHVIPEISSLLYRGYPVDELAQNCTFEEVAYLLICGELPTAAQLREFKNLEQSQRHVSTNLLDIIQRFPADGHPMDAVRTGVSYLGMEDPEAEKIDPTSYQAKSIQLLARIPTIIAANFRCQKGEAAISPKPSLSIAENFFHMCFGEVPSAEIVKAFDGSMTLYAEHSFNASTFTARVVTSSMADIYSAVTAAIGSLRGPLHGGANEQVMHMLKKIGDPSKAEEWIHTALRERQKVMGFGHRVYKKWDSRAPIMKAFGTRLAELKKEKKWAEISEILERVMREEKNIYPNLDFPAGPAFYLMGFDIEMFTCLFVMSRITGWAAHIMEQAADNRLIRPLSEYIGPTRRPVVPLEQREQLEPTITK